MLASLFDTLNKARRRGASASPSTPSETPEADPEPATRAAVVERLMRVIDPEVGINIVDLGLVYDVQVNGPAVALVLTMTTPACPMSSYITKRARAALKRLPGVETIDVELAWHPAWSPQMMNPDVRRRLLGR